METRLEDKRERKIKYAQNVKELLVDSQDLIRFLR